MHDVRDFALVTVTIAEDATTSGAVDVRRYSVFAIEYPAAMTGATLSITACRTQDGTFLPLHIEDGSALAALTKPTTLPAVQVLDGSAIDLSGLAFIKLVSASAEAAARTFYLWCKS